MAVERHSLGWSRGVPVHPDGGLSAGLSTDLLAERQDVDHLSDLDPWLV